MDLNRTPARVAEDAAEEIRALNHRTLSPKAYEQAPDVCGVVEALTALVQRMPQALTQAEAGLRAIDERDGIRLDTGYGSRKEITDAVAAALGGLRNAREFLDMAHEQLRAAAGPLSHMGGPWPDGESDEV